LETLPQLLQTSGDRQRLVALLNGILTRETLKQLDPSPEQLDMLKKIQALLRRNNLGEGPSNANHPARRCRTPQRST